MRRKCFLSDPHNSRKCLHRKYKEDYRKREREREISCLQCGRKREWRHGRTYKNKRERVRERERGDDHFTEAHLLQSTPFLSDRIELMPSLPTPAPPRFAVTCCLDLSDGRNSARGLALVVSLYCNLFPRQMFLSQNTVTFIPKSPHKHIKWTLHVYVGRGRQTWQGQWQECRVKEAGKEWSGQTDRDVRHMLTPADDTRMTWRSKGRPGAERSW